MRFDVTDIVLELILTAAAVFWWMSRTPNTTQNCRRKHNWYLIWPGFGPYFAPVNYPLESLLVNIASLSGTVLGDVLRPSQAIFSVLLVLHDAWPLLFTLVASSSNNTPSLHPSSETGGLTPSTTTASSSSSSSSSSNASSSNASSSLPQTNSKENGADSVEKIPNRKNWMRLIYISSIFMLIYFFLYLVLGDHSSSKKHSGIGLMLLHYGAVLSGYFAGFGALLVAARHTVDYSNHAEYQDRNMGKNNNGNENNSSTTSTPSSFRPAPQHDVLNSSTAIVSSSSNVIQHWALVATYFVYGIMLLVDFATLWESGPWLLYVSGSVFIEVVKHYWIFRVKSLNVDTVV